MSPSDPVASDRRPQGSSAYLRPTPLRRHLPVRTQYLSGIALCLRNVARSTYQVRAPALVLRSFSGPSLFKSNRIVRQSPATVTVKWTPVSLTMDLPGAPHTTLGN